MTPDGRTIRGERTRAAVLDTAVAMATQAGLDGLSLGQIADRLGVSKSGLFAHWRSKEDLQLATIERAREQWADRILAPALRAPRGIRRLWALHEARLDFYRSKELPGVCFFAGAKFEYSARPGAVRDRLAEVFGEWLTLIERVTTEAVAEGELRSDVDPKLLAYEIDALGDAVVIQFGLVRPDASELARRAALARLRALATDPTLLPEE